MTEPLISLHGISRSFQAGEDTITVLRDVDIDIWPGELVAIVGASGSGKSTLMNILGCLDRPTSGVYRFGGQDVGGLEADALARLRREHFGFIFQRYQLLADLNAVGNVEVPAIYAGESRQSRRDRAEELLTKLGLGDRLNHRPGELSGGQQQRVSVARALMNGGEVILADEPTGALDSKSSAELIDLMLDLNGRGHTMVIVTHDPEVAKHARRVIEIRDGKVISDLRTHDDRDRTDAMGMRVPRPAGPGAALRRLKEAMAMSILALLAHRVRSVLTMLGIIIGIASVVLVVALGTGTQEKVLENISSLGTNTISIRSGSGFGSRDAHRTETLVPPDASALELQSYAESVSPAVSNTASVVFRNVEASASINGVSGGYFEVHAYETVAGNVFDANDVTDRGQVAVIDEDARDTFFSDGSDPLGQVLLVDHVPVRVIGVVRSTGASFGPSSLNVWVPYTTAMARISGQDHLDSISVRVADDYDMGLAQQEISVLMLQRHGTRDFFLSNSDTIRETITSTTQTLTILVAMIAVISLIVGGIGVMNIMLVSVTERTKEIGVRIAIGARRSDIVSQFLIEAILVCLVGGIVGVVCAMVGGQLVSVFIEDVRLSFSTIAIVLAFISSTAIGVTFGFLPARSAARLDPVVALSRE
ncbi:MacB family efflux pump subunit [Pseudoruegeria sp. HB172150]|uniref:MacB family efflux pump subunit n=1 Tax=Pseudoruegeria sp. HB172150 TaxID=2721164 RepID=UPI0020A6CC14|nr:MacB family efflux pump subunit [Pseudoruegeria sp. HB172150]